EGGPVDLPRGGWGQMTRGGLSLGGGFNLGGFGGGGFNMGSFMGGGFGGGFGGGGFNMGGGFNLGGGNIGSPQSQFLGGQVFGGQGGQPMNRFQNDGQRNNDFFLSQQQKLTYEELQARRAKAKEALDDAKKKLP